MRGYSILGNMDFSQGGSLFNKEVGTIANVQNRNNQYQGIDSYSLINKNNSLFNTPMNNNSLFGNQVNTNEPYTGMNDFKLNNSLLSTPQKPNPLNNNKSILNPDESDQGVANSYVSKSGPWGAVLATASKMGSSLTDTSSSKTVRGLGVTILDPSRNVKEGLRQDLSFKDRLGNWLLPGWSNYRGIDKTTMAKKKALKDQRKEDLMNINME